MNILGFFGVGGDKIRANNCGVPGTVRDVSRCWWITINTKPVRRYPGLVSLIGVVGKDFCVDVAEFRHAFTVRERLPAL